MQDEYTDILKEYWGKDALFKDVRFYQDPSHSRTIKTISQRTIIEDIVSECAKAAKGEEYDDIVITASTGIGKSLLFQIPAIYLADPRRNRTVTIVVEPLISLMIDQVQALHKRGVTCATFINSNLSAVERNERYAGVRIGRYSIVYLSPELLTKMDDVGSLLGNRYLGMLVIDEAHTVNSWGKSFRTDYWFLGDTVRYFREKTVKTKEKGSQFPVVCLTATAAYSGKGGALREMQEALYLHKPHIFFGEVKRGNIEFIIRHPKRDKTKPLKDQKEDLAVQEAGRILQQQKNAIIYIPFARQVMETLAAINIKWKNPKSLGRYYSGSDMSKEVKNEEYRRFMAGDCKLMLATKAFGMGIDKGDIHCVYHYALSDGMSEYIQEVGRAARNISAGCAVEDYLPGEMKFAKQLQGMSESRQWQLREMLWKLESLLKKAEDEVQGEKEGILQLLVTPDDFSHIFTNESSSDRDSDVRRGFIFLQSDLEQRYGMRVIHVMPHTLLTDQYIMVPADQDQEMQQKYGHYISIMDDVRTQFDKVENLKTGKTGQVYHLNLEQLWKTCPEFSQMTYNAFKKSFFGRSLLQSGDDASRIVPQIRLEIKFEEAWPLFQEKLSKVLATLDEIVKFLRNEYGSRYFSRVAFRKAFKQYDEENLSEEKINSLLEIFTSQSNERKANYHHCFCKHMNGMETEYRLYGERQSLGDLLRRCYFDLIRPGQHGSFVIYIPTTAASKRTRGLKDKWVFVASFLELFKLASYTMQGGVNPKIAVNVIRTDVIYALTEDSKVKYENQVVKELRGRHDRELRIMDGFLKGDFSSEERWNIIEDYFLGRDDEVEAMLGWEDDVGNAQ